MADQKLYIVNGKMFVNKHNATLWHLARYGDANWQATVTYNETKKQYESFKPIKKLVDEWTAEEKELKGEL